MEYSAILDEDANQSIVVSSSAVGLTLPAYYSTLGILGGQCRIQVRTAPILFTVNGFSPDLENEATGEKANIGDIIILDTLVEMRNINMCRATSTNGAVFVTYLKAL